MKAYAGAIDQALSAAISTAECSADAMSNDTMTGEKKGNEFAAVFRPDHVVHGKSSGSHCKWTARLGPWRRGECSFKLTLQRTMRDSL